MILTKIRVSDVRPICRSLYVNDLELLTKQGSNIGVSLDILVERAYAISLNSYSYKVIGDNGSLVGLFCAPKNELPTVSLFYIKKEARTDDLLVALFWKLAADTVAGKVYGSFSSINALKFSDYIVKKITILGPYKYSGENFNIT